MPRSIPMTEKGNFDFSFSGLKTSVRYFLEKHPEIQRSTEGLADLCASIRGAIVGVLILKAGRAVEESGLRRLAVSGGVSANRALRRGLEDLCALRGWDLHLPSPELSTDNAAMMAFAALHHLAAGEQSSLGLEVLPRWDVGPTAVDE